MTHASPYDVPRRQLLKELVDQGINDIDVLASIQCIPRELFIPAADREEAYANHPVPVGYGQTISQPFIIARMTTALALTKESKVLEIGTGSGYQTAILARLAREVYSIERIPALSQQAQQVLSELHYSNVHFRVGDGTLGWPEAAPFDSIIVTAAGPKIPPRLADQLVEGGRLVMPVESTDSHLQRLYLYLKKDGELEPQFLGGCRFVPLVGADGWQADETIK
ncbi:protein-L-isoaspartate(D-aspartate) O-methyltransferase [bacterium]|jgi:protein-L-isoaspartate(D-aspartate) O-methyltransferase|nr:protein-L-isoaspartate(D-aspartate) O-methyltransferase [bacterium]